MKTYYWIALLAVAGVVWGQPPDTMWTYTYASSYDDDAYSIESVVDGGFVVGGKTWLPDSGYRALLIRLDSEGHEVWTRTYPGDFSCVNAIAEFSDGGWALAGGAGPFCPMMIIRVDSAGNLRWLRCINHMYIEEAISIVVTPEDGVALLSKGRFGSSPDIDFVRLDSEGDSLWMQTYGGSAEDHGGAVLLTEDNGFFIAGSRNNQAWVIKTDSLGELQWHTTFGDPIFNERLLSASMTSTGNFAVAGWWQNDSSVAYHPFAALVSASGDTLWTNYFPHMGTGQFTSVSCFLNGNILLGGGGGDAYIVVLLTADGDTIWTTRYDTPIDDIGTALCLTPDSGFAMAGYQHTSAENSHNIWVIRSESLLPISVNHRINPPYFKLNYPYPNPFNATTTLSFSLSHASPVSLTIFNVLGQAVYQVDLGRLNAGEHRHLFDANDLPSGVYVARVQAGEQSQMRKMVLLK